MTQAKEDAMTVSAVLTTVSDLKASSESPEEVTATDNSNEFEDEGDEGKENSAAVENNTSNAAMSKPESDASSPAKLDNATIELPTETDSSEELVGKESEEHPLKKSPLNRSIVRKRKRFRSVLPTRVLSSTAGRTVTHKRKSPPQSEDDAFEFDGNEDDHKETTKEQESRTEGSEQDDSSMNNSTTGKRTHPDASALTTTLPKKKQNTENDSQLKEPEAAISNQEVVTEYEKQAQNPFELPEAEAEDSPSKEFQFKLPPELAPFNNPGVCDYGVIRASRLRNRKKKKTIGDDVPYQNIQGQRRCRATRDGKKMLGSGNTNRCLNCAEGVFKYCHTHRDLDEDQKLYWEKRKLRESQIASAPAPARRTEVAKEPPPKSMPRSKQSMALLQMQCVEVPDNIYENVEPRRCVVLVQGKGRCFRNSLYKLPGFCYGHSSWGEKMQTEKTEIFSGQPGTLRCTAVSKVGTKCKFKSLYQCVFCPKHTSSPPERASSVQYISPKRVKEEKTGSIVNVESIGEPTKASSRKMGQNRSIAMGSNVASTMHELKDIASSILEKRTKPRKSPRDEVPKNIEFRKSIELSNQQIEMATSFDNMCFNVYKSKRCWYKRAEGAILCHKCLVCHEVGTTFDHILDKDVRADESILFSSHCVKFDKGEQCSRMAVNGKILCSKCLQMTKSSLESSEDSRVSNADATHNNSDSSSSATFSSDSDSEDSRVSDDTDYDAYCMAYKHKEFFDMWKNWERKTERMDEVEDSRLIKRANNTMSPTDTDGQVKAQYGRVLPHAMKKMIKLLELRREDVFLDIGHGVGNTCLHASFCTGCDSRGIEVVSDRHEIADKFRGGMYAEHHCRNGPKPEVGKVDLRLGRLEDPKQKDFLTKGITRAYVNNFNGVFAERSSKNKDKWFLDDYISGIFASMAPGAIMVTFHPLNLGLDRESANELRSKHNLLESDHASYYDSEKILLGKAFCSVKWNKRSGNTNEIYVYKYRRLHQPGHHDAVFLCSNPSCKLATDMVPIPATTQNEDGRCVINHCECKFSPKNLRKRSSKQSP